MMRFSFAKFRVHSRAIELFRVNGRGARLALAWLLGMALTVDLAAQQRRRQVPTEGQATVTGRVFSTETGLPLGSATVMIEGPALVDLENWRIERKTNAEGAFTIFVPPGGYELSAHAPEFEEAKVKLQLGVSESAQRDFRLVPKPRSYAYHVETVELPRQMVPEVSGLAFTPKGSLVAVNRRGEVWMRTPDGRTWSRFAFGLYEPFGVFAKSEREIYVMQRPELTRLRDTDGDGRADQFETIDDSWGISGNYHEFTYGLGHDSMGNFYGGLGMVSAGELPWVRGPLNEKRVVPWTGRGPVPDGHRAVVKYQGWVFRIGGDGTFEPLATGFRQPIGIGVSPADELFVTDVSGSWVPSSVLYHVEQGKFYGHPDGLKWDPNFKDAVVTPDMLKKMRTPPAVYLPRGPMGASPGEPVWDLTGGKFGPFTGQMFLGDVMSLVIRVYLEKVAGVYQGAAFPLLRNEGLRIGGMRSVFAPDGSLYSAHTVRGWMSAAGNEGIQRITWTGVNPVEIYSMRLTARGFALAFTEGMLPDELNNARRFHVRRFQYDYHILDGSLRVNEVEVPVAQARSTEDGTGVDLALAEMLPGFVYELKLDPMKSRSGRALLNPEAYYTVNRLLSGETTYATSIIQPPKDTGFIGAPDPIAGAETFRQNCVVCHQPDGRGSLQVGTPNFTEAGGRLSQADEVLLQSIRGGKGLVMPAFGSVLPERDIRNALAYLRATFQPKPAAK